MRSLFGPALALSVILVTIGCGDDAPSSSTDAAADAAGDGGNEIRDGGRTDMSVPPADGTVDVSSVALEAGAPGTDARPSGTDGGAPDGAELDARAGLDGGALPPNAGPIGPAANITGCGLIRVDGETIFELLAEDAVAVQRAGDRILTVNATGRWVLWSTATNAPVAVGVGAAKETELRGGLFAVRPDAAGPHEIRAAQDGRRIATVPDEGFKRLAPSRDGRYLWAVSSSGLYVWEPSGALRFRAPGDYSAADIYAGANEIAVARGPAGADRVQVLAATNGAPTVSQPYLGAFVRWFEDGARFLTAGQGIQRAYSLQGLPQGIYTFPGTVTQFGGFGDLVWAWAANNLHLYRAGADSTEIPGITGLDGSYVPVANGPFLALGRTFPKRVVDLVRLDVPNPTRISFDVNPTSVRFYTVDPAGGWVVGGHGFQHGTLMGATGVAGCGALVGFSGGGSRGHVASLAFKARTAVLDLRTNPTKVQSVFAVDLVGGGTAIAADGGFFAALMWADGAGPRVVDTMTGMVAIQAFEHWTITLSKAGNLAAGRRGAETTIWSTSSQQPLLRTDGAGAIFSEDGSRIALNSGGGATRLLDATGKLVNIVPGVPIFWTSEGLLATHSQGVTSIVDRDGTPRGVVDRSVLPLSAEGAYYPASGGRLYVPFTGDLFQITPTEKVATLPKDGVIVGDRLVYRARGALLRTADGIVSPEGAPVINVRRLP
jgi:hypothetical protein